MNSLRSAAIPLMAAALTAPLFAQDPPSGMGRDFRMLGEGVEHPGPAGAEEPGSEAFDLRSREVWERYRQWADENLRDAPPEMRERMRMQLERMRPVPGPGPGAAPGPDGRERADQIREMIEPMRREILEMDPGVREIPRWRIGLGAVPVEPVLRSHLDIPKDRGLMVTEVLPESPAAKAGIVRDDILVSAGDRKLAQLDDLREAVQAAGKAGRPLPLTVIHEGKRRQVKLEPQGPPAETRPKPEADAKRPMADRPMDGPAPRIMAEMNRRFERMERRLNEMSQRIDRQQRLIEQLRSQREAQPAPQRRRPAVEATPAPAPAPTERAQPEEARDRPARERARERERERDRAPESDAVPPSRPGNLRLAE